VEEKAEDQDGMEQAEHDLLADLRRARRSLRLQGMDQPPVVAHLKLGQRIADAVATVMGSWSFIIVQSAILFAWIAANLIGAMRGWDPYPFILLNLALSFQAAYAAPVIMMSQNLQQDIDRKAAENDYRINVKAELEIELLHEKIDQLREREVLKLTEAVRTLTELLERSASGARESDAEGGRLHNARLSTSWRDVISHSPPEIPCFTVRCERQPVAATAKSNKDPTIRRLQMSVQQPVLTPPHGGETVTSSGGSSVEMKVESSQSGGEYGVVMWTVRAGEEPPLHTHSREDELLYVVQGKLIARVGDARVEVGPGAYAALPRGVPHTIEVVGDQATLLLSFVPGGLERFLVPRKGEQPDPAAFGLTFP
jgi:uncharacterized membrane protein/quercetin dioxygenase-like cupin family protein